MIFRSSIAPIRERNVKKFKKIREPSSKRKTHYSINQFVQKEVVKKYKKGYIHQIPKLFVLTLVYHLLGSESSQARYSASVLGPVNEISKDG